jgi:hypothetical protein
MTHDPLQQSLNKQIRHHQVMVHNTGSFNVCNLFKCNWIWAAGRFWNVVLGQLRETIWSGIHGGNWVQTVTSHQWECDPPYVLLTTETYSILCSAQTSSELTIMDLYNFCKEICIHIARQLKRTYQLLVPLLCRISTSKYYFTEAMLTLFPSHHNLLTRRLPA